MGDGNMYGAKSARLDRKPELKKMLQYAVEDEYLARSEYEIAINTFGDEKPFPNIINSEVTHINWLKELFNRYNLEVPEDESKKYLGIPGSLKTAIEYGIDAEIENINMYENFLGKDIPDDVRSVFTKLRDASKGHLVVLKKRLEVPGI
jgi:rubrerythrin